MNAAAKLSGFAATLGVLFIAGAAVGGAVDPAAPGAGDRGASHETAAAAHGGSEGTHGSQPAAPAVRGLAVAQDGLRLVLVDATAEAGAPEPLEFRVVDEAGSVVRDFDVAHESACT